MIKLLLAAGETVGVEALSALGLDAADFAAVVARPAGAAALPVAWTTRAIESDGSFPRFGAIHDQLRAESPDACVLLDDGIFCRLFGMAGDVLGIPTVRLVGTVEQLRNLPSREKTKPDLFLLTDAGLLPSALNDERYGFTMIALPGSRDEFGDSFRTAVKAWASDKLDARRPDLSVVVPAFKEAENLPLVCSRLLAALAPADFSWEVVLVDDFSPDATYKVALEQMRRSSRIRAFTKGTPRGMGNAIRHGLRMARAPVAAVTMGDGSDEVERIPDMYRAIRDGGYSLAIGSRYRRAENYANVPRVYRFWSSIFRLTARILTGVKLSDYTNAFRAFSMSIFSRYGPESGGFEISPEITFKAWLSSRKVTEVDVRHLKRASGQSKFSFLKAGPGYARILIKAVAGRLTGKWFTLDW
jgi:hypothetical protein